MAALRILHLDTERGWRGGQLQVRLLHRGLCRLGIDSTVLCRADQPLAAKLVAEGLPVLAVSEGFGFSLRATHAARQFARRTSGTLLHAHASAAHGIARLAITGRSEPLITTRRVDFPLRPSAGRGWKYGPRTTRCVAVSRSVAAILIQGGVEPARVEVIHDGVEPPPPGTGTSEAASLGLPVGRLRVLCAAAFAAHKGHRILLDAWRLIEARGLPVSLLLAGRGELEAALRTQAQGLRHVHFLGWREDIADLWANVDLAVLSSLEEGLGSTLIDAQAAGVPVVATTAGGIPEIVTDGISGLLVPPGDATALANALGRLATDPELRANLGRGAVTQAQGFLASAMVQRYLDLYQRIAGP